jgi:YD repeat-containing protein
MSREEQAADRLMAYVWHVLDWAQTLEWQGIAVGVGISLILSYPVVRWVVGKSKGIVSWTWRAPWAVTRGVGRLARFVGWRLPKRVLRGPWALARRVWEMWDPAPGGSRDTAPITLSEWAAWAEIDPNVENIINMLSASNQILADTMAVPKEVTDHSAFLDWARKYQDPDKPKLVPDAEIKPYESEWDAPSGADDWDDQRLNEREVNSRGEVRYTPPPLLGSKLYDNDTWVNPTAATDADALREAVKYDGNGRVQRVDPQRVFDQRHPSRNHFMDTSRPPDGYTIAVEATAKGYYGNTIRRVGDQFWIVDQAHLGTWMKVIHDTRVGKPEKKKLSVEEIFYGRNT